ncbi:MAG: NADH-quinone oxidoreductase subunit E, partial [Bacteroidetes bacterium HGW-Bacteroidetes-22]
MESNKLSRVDYIFRPETNRLDLLKRVMSKDKDDFLLELIDSGLKGRGGAGFLTGL